MKRHIPERLATIGGILISVSGLLNTILGLQIGAIYYEVYPGGNMGHVGMVAGLAALVLGIAIVFPVATLYRKDNRRHLFLAGILTIILGHLGAIAGALYIGTLGLILCYIAGIWILLAAFRI